MKTMLRILLPSHSSGSSDGRRHCVRAGALLLAVTAFASAGPVAAQPPEPPPFELRPEGFAMARAWDRLREDSASLMILEPAKAATAFQKFLDDGGNQIPGVVVEATTLIAQIYWQELGDKEKAIAVYTAGIAATPGFPPAQRLTRELEAIRSNRRAVPNSVYLAPQLRS